MVFNEKLISLRKQKHLSQLEAAEKLFVSRQAISKWENGESFPSVDSLKLIAKFYGVTIDFLLDDEQDSFSPSCELKISSDPHEGKKHGRYFLFYGCFLPH